MSLRVTRQYAEALAAGVGSARVTRQYVEVLGPVLSGEYLVSAADTLVLSGFAAATLVLTVSAENSLALAQTAVAELVRGSLDSVAHDEAALAHAAQVVGVYTRRVADTLTITQQAAGNFVKRVDAFSFVTLDGAVVVENLKPVAHVLALADQATVDLVRSGHDGLTLGHETQAVLVYDRSVSDALSLAQTPAFTCDILRGVGDSLGLGHGVIVHLCKVGQSGLALSHEAQVEKLTCILDTLSLDHEAGREAVWGRRRTDALALSQVATGQREVSRSIGQVVVLAHGAVADVVRAAGSTLVLSDSAAVDKCYVSSHALALSDEATVTTNRVGAQSHLLTLAHEARVGFVKHVGAHDNLATTLKDAAGYAGPRYVSASDRLAATYQNYDPVTGELTDFIAGLQDTASAALVPSQPRTAGHLLSFAERAIGIVVRADAIPATASDTLTLADATCVNTTPLAASALALTDAAAAVVCKLVRDALELEDEARVAGVFNLAAESVLDIRQHVGFTATIACWDHLYHPFVGDGSGGPTPPSASLDGPVAGIGGCRLVYPAEDRPITDTVALRSPDFGNKDRLQFNRISRETRGGTLVVYADPIWPKVQAQVLTFSGLTRTQAHALLTFMAAHLGQEVGFVDWEGRYWKGVIVNPTDPVVQDGKDRFTASFEFEGELAEWEP